MYSTFRAALVALCILLIATYPASPVLFLVFTPDPYIVYMLIIMAAVFMAPTNLGFTKSCIILIPRHLKISLSLLLISGFLTYLTTGNLAAIREISSLLCILFIMGTVGTAFISKTTRWIVYLYSVLMALSICVALIYMPLHEQMDGWSVAQGIVPSPNPIISRSDGGDFDYYFPMFMSVIPIDDSFDVWTRLPMLFTEATYLYYFTLPVLSIAIIDNMLVGKKTIVCTLVLALLLGRSYAGMLIIFSVFCIVLVCGGSGRSILKRAVYAVIGLVLMVILFLIFEHLLFVEKQDQFERYINNGILENGFPDGGLLGRFDEIEYEKLSNDYGVLTIIGRYGLLGAGVWIIFLISFVVMWSREIIRSKKLSLIIGGGLFISACVMGVKVPYFINGLLIFLITASLAAINVASSASVKTTE